jgi:hypothetical protein
MAEFIPKLDIETMMRRKQFAQIYLSCEEILIHSLFVDEQRFWYVKCYNFTGKFLTNS